MKPPRLAANHPLRAQIVERRAWIALDQWHCRKAAELFDAGLKIRKENLSQNNSQSWSFILFDEQGKAMAEHFLGNKSEALETFDRLTKSIGADLREESGLRRPLSKREQSDRQERLPNILQRQADCYLFGPQTSGNEASDFAAAAGLLLQGANEAENHDFHLDYRWPYYVCLGYEYCAALVKAADRQTALNELARFDTFVSNRLSAEEANARQPYDSARAVADALIRFSSTDPDEQQGGLNDLRKIVEDKPVEQINRKNIQVILLAAETLLQSESPLVDINCRERLSRRLRVITEEMRKSPDTEVTSKFLQRYYQAAYDALKDDAGNQELLEIEKLLKPSAADSQS